MDRKGLRGLVGKRGSMGKVNKKKGGLRPVSRKNLFLRVGGLCKMTGSDAGTL